MANIEMVLNKFIKEDQPDHPLIIDENKIPNTAFLHNAIQSDNRSYFFGKENNRVDYDLISSVYLMDYQFKNQTENFGKKNPYAADFNIPPLLGNDGVLFSKEGPTLFRLSLDESNPGFQEINLKNNKINLMSFSKAKEMISTWLKNDPQTAEKTLEKLGKIYSKTTASKLKKPSTKKIYPHFSDIYRYFALKDCFNLGSKQLDIVSNNFPIPPVLTKGKKLILKKNNIFYKIEFGKKITFERLSNLGHFLMTRNELDGMLSEIKKHRLFNEKTNAVCSALNVVYRQNVAPEFSKAENDQIPVKHSSRPSDPNLYLLRTGLDKTA
ncbi:MAG: hypothetical protein J6V53_02740 [Alphaproteobacteria bacterium]|nr:hypothetical protein [Alphaproteobacteria bacterium]